MSELDRLLRKGEPRKHRPGWITILGRWAAKLLGSRASPGDSRSASDVLARVRALREAQAGWPGILAVVNPGNDRVAAELLVRLRGPHQFAPHVALNALEDGCERVLAADSHASDIDALREALRQSGLVTRVGE